LGKLIGGQDAVPIPFQPVKPLTDLVPAGDPRLVLGAAAELSMH